MSQYAFGSGVLIGVRTDVANPTPAPFGVLQEASVEFSFNTKELYGQKQFPVAVARGLGKVSGKAKYANINGRVWNDLFFNSSMATGERRMATGESGTIPTTPFQITVANSATFLSDLGVWDVALGKPMQRVASSPATGQYSVSASGVYTFASADTGKSVLIYYDYTVAASGNTITISNQLLGVQSFFKIVLSTSYNSKQLSMTLNRCMSSKMAFGTKQEDFLVPDFDFSAFADDSDVVGYLSVAE